ncbi:MAG: quinoprotein dehydrogenase-associated SoxYZ-like carrier [Hyphomicrobium sp.]|jgi:sulfur-oxidizing protein SoxY|nr:quinoprotein dehydrogenase-associated SoxYZ-like carrier [Hyphomicrobium sp.]PPD06087.1 MAG: quinoprotein dehydrogenase-associated SoxYZ-like carrier [Hyphomicrobium sp.]
MQVHRLTWKASFAAAALAIVAVGASPVTAAEPASGNALIEADLWPTLQKDIFGAKVPAENASVVTIEAPPRADDAALVPVTVRIPADAAKRVTRMTLIVDKNPAPVVAEFAYGPAAGEGERVLSTRVRVDMYSNVRAVVETDDGKLHMATKFVKAAGGCSAPALKDTDAALADAGRMIVKTLETTDAAAGLRQGQLMIKHPQYSGLQLNQATGFYIPARFVREIDVKRGNDLVFKMTGGISISEDPNFRFTYAAGSDETLDVTATDTEGKVFTGRTGPKGS